ncbi:hypothetical protein ACETAC_09675 [Aceticella autotrophica]|uniref:Uncharacterized protein n=1 Tax=Aceticella autotrophica TaxID=2755338 RepID=A0A975GAH8_9THEO|nr:hypothetical protein [Aceticella autotrophica]QSZ27117.1 hypothetical protein ACETAC_09675 [Aceticella autotrophica]
MGDSLAVKVCYGLVVGIINIAYCYKANYFNIKNEIKQNNLTLFIM